MKIVNVSDVSNFLKIDFYGKDFEINRASSLDKIVNNSISFSKNTKVKNINCEILLLVPMDFNYSEGRKYSVIKVKNPRLVFAKVLKEFFVKKIKKEIDKTSVIGLNSNIHSCVSIGSHCNIGDNVFIGKNTIINNNVTISDNTVIGENCYIKSGTVLGEDGFGFDFEEDGKPIRIPHLGNLLIGDNVEIGANSVIARGTLNSTIIEDNVKIDDCVFVAHNCLIKQNTVIIAFAEISGSVTVGKNCWIGPNSSIIQKVNIGDNVTVGIGAIVIKDIEARKKVMGFESLDLRSLLKFKKRIAYGK